MKYVYIALLGMLAASCNTRETGITGTAHGLNGEMVSISDLQGNVIDSAIVSNDQYQLKLADLPAPGYFTLSVQQGGHPRDFEIYLENVKYVIDIPVKTTDYLRIKTTSKTQNNLSVYCNFEDSLMYKSRHEADSLNAHLADPANKKLSDAEFDKKVKEIQIVQAREDGERIGIISAFVDKYPKNEILLHIIADMNYKDNPQEYYMIYQKLSPAAKNTSEGKRLGTELQHLVDMGK